jgi:hypothetical protein
MTTSWSKYDLCPDAFERKLNQNMTTSWSKYVRKFRRNKVRPQRGHTTISRKSFSHFPGPLPETQAEIPRYFKQIKRWKHMTTSWSKYNLCPDAFERKLNQNMTTSWSKYVRKFRRKKDSTTSWSHNNFQRKFQSLSRAIARNPSGNPAVF